MIVFASKPAHRIASRCGAKETIAGRAAAVYRSSPDRKVRGSGSRLQTACAESGNGTDRWHDALNLGFVTAEVKVAGSAPDNVVRQRPALASIIGRGNRSLQSARRERISIERHPWI